MDIGSPADFPSVFGRRRTKEFWHFFSPDSSGLPGDSNRTETEGPANCLGRAHRQGVTDHVVAATETAGSVHLPADGAITSRIGFASTHGWFYDAYDTVFIIHRQIERRIDALEEL